MYSNWENKKTKQEYLFLLKSISKNHVEWREKAVERIGNEIKGGIKKEDGTLYTYEDFIAWVDEDSKIHKKSLLEEFGTENIDEIFYNESNDSFVIIPPTIP